MALDNVSNLISPGVNKDHLWQMAMSFQVSKAIFIASNLDIFTIISRKPATGENLAKKLKLQPRPVLRLLNTMVAFGLLRKKDEKFFNTKIADTFLVRGRPEYFGNYLNVVNEVYNAWADYEKVIVENHSLPLYRKQYTEGMEVVRRMMLAQEAFSYRQAVCLPKVYDFSKHKLLLDVGGGTGIFSVMAVKANPHLNSIVFDVPAVCTIARERIKFYQSGKKIKIVEGNFIIDELPRGADVVLLSTVLDAYDEHDCRKLIEKVFECLEPGGVVIANEMMLNENCTGPLFPALFSLELMIERDRGDARRVNEIRRWIKEAGFADIKVRPLWLKGERYLNCKIVIGKKYK
jgi:hypothetical protein